MKRYRRRISGPFPGFREPRSKSRIADGVQRIADVREMIVDEIRDELGLGRCRKRREQIVGIAADGDDDGSSVRCAASAGDAFAGVAGDERESQGWRAGE